MDSKSTLRRPSEPLGPPFGYKPYLKTLLDTILAPFGGPSWDPFGGLWASCSCLGPSKSRKSTNFEGSGFKVIF